MNKKVCIIGLIILEAVFAVVLLTNFVIPSLKSKSVLSVIEYSEGTSVSSYLEKQAETETEAPTEAPDDGSISASVASVEREPDRNRIQIVSADASSVGYEKEPSYMIDSDLSTSWQEGETGYGEGSRVKFTFDGEHKVKAIALYLGVWREEEGRDCFSENGRPQEVDMTIGDYVWTLTFRDDKKIKLVEFDKPISASEITFEILKVFEGTKYEDTGISEVVVFE